MKVIGQKLVNEHVSNLDFQINNAIHLLVFKLFSAPVLRLIRNAVYLGV